MKDLGIAVVMLMWATIAVGTFGWAWEYIRDRRIKRYEASEKRIPTLLAQGTLRRKER